EESMLSWVMSGGALPVLLPRGNGSIPAAELVGTIDGLLLQGGSDMSPLHYGEEPLRPEWTGDAARDLYEVQVIRLCLAAGKPLLGGCRGARVWNVALGGSLWQDIQTLHPQTRVHRDWDVYDQHEHEIAFEPGSLLDRWYGHAASGQGKVNSIHHQGLR